MAKANKPKPEDVSEVDYLEEEIVYTRRRRVYKFYCQLDNCPYCRNVQLNAFNPKRRWCREEARAELRRRERALIAIQNKRHPGLRGRPFDPSEEPEGIFFIHFLDQLLLYQIGFFISWDEYAATYLIDPAPQHNFDGTLVIATPLVTLLEYKITVKFEELKVEDNRYRLEPADVRIAHHMILEHLEACRT